MHDEVILTKEEYKDFIVAKEKLNLLESIIGNCISVEYGSPRFSDYEFTRAMETIGYKRFDGIWKEIRQKRIAESIERETKQEKENENE